MTDIVAVDIGGTHARFAIASLADGTVAALRQEAVLKSADFPSLAMAWKAYDESVQAPLPRAAAIAVACPVDGEELRLTNNPWVIRPALLPGELGIDRFSLINDFGAVANAVARLEPSAFRHISGPDQPLPDPGAISIVGPGTGLGVALLIRGPEGTRIIEAEGGHATFAPRDEIDDRILARLRRAHGRVSIERVVSGPGLSAIHAALANADGEADPPPLDDATLWALALGSRALGDGDPLAAAAIERFCECLGSVAGDIALTQGSSAVVIAGGLGLRLADRLAASGFGAAFTGKGRMAPRLARMPVKLITHPQPGLFGAAAAFARDHGPR
jgi:glucokinase